MTIAPWMGISIRRGERVDDAIEVGSLPDGTTIRLPVIALSGKSDGPILYVQAGVHGDEVTGIALLWRALNSIDLDDLTGTIVAVPLANPAAALTKSRGFVLEERGPFDLNRIFPGNSTGVMSERIASVLFDGFVRHADVAVDLHSALAGCDIYPFTYVDPYDDEAGTLEVRERLARAMGTPLVYRKARGSKLGTSVMTGSLATQADAIGIPLVMIEMGRSGVVSREHIDSGAAGLINVARASGVLKGEVSEPESQDDFSVITLVHSTTAGLFESYAQLGELVSDGDRIGSVMDVRSGRAVEVVAPVSGRVLRLMNDMMVMPGAELCWVAT